MKAITDTGFLVAFTDRRDPHHAWAMSIARQINAPLLTCEAVLAETAFHLEDAATTLAMVTEGLVELAFDAAGHLTELVRLASRYRDRKPDLADLCLIRMSELHPKHIVITTDEKDFRIYRRHDREVIPILTPASLGASKRSKKKRRART